MNIKKIKKEILILILFLIPATDLLAAPMGGAGIGLPEMSPVAIPSSAVWLFGSAVLVIGFIRLGRRARV